MGHVSEFQRIEKDEQLAGGEAIAKVRELLPSFKTAMFVTGVRSGQELHSRPLAIKGDARKFAGALWFFADDRSPKVYELAVNTTVSLFFQNDGATRYMQLDGTASLSYDHDKVSELYTPDADKWFAGGIDDPHLTLIRVDVSRGAYWEQHDGAWRAASGLLAF